MRIRNWIEWTQQMPKIWEKIRTRTYCKFLLLPIKCESQSGPENQMIREMSSHCDKNSAHNVGGKYRWIPLLDSFRVWYFNIFPSFVTHIMTHNVSDKRRWIPLKCKQFDKCKRFGECKEFGIVSPKDVYDMI